jgi:glutamine amidotransferase
MCLLTYIPAGKKPDMEALREGTVHNRDGHGWAIATPSIIYRGRGLDRNWVLDEFEEMRDYYPEYPALFHSRMATHGNIKKDNCHPFYLGNDGRTVIGHNGILDSQPKKGDWRSDTRVAAEDLFPKWKLWSRAGRRKLYRWGGTFNKFVILTNNPRYGGGPRGIIINSQAGEWHNGIWYSNSSYKPYKLPKRSYEYYQNSAGWYVSRADGAKDKAASKVEEFDPERWICAVCQTGRVNPVSCYCTNDECRSCQDCESAFRDCQCWMPESLRKVVNSDPYDADLSAAVTDKELQEAIEGAEMRRHTNSEMLEWTADGVPMPVESDAWKQE